MACICGHTEEQHGHDPEFPGSTACNMADGDGDDDDDCKCIAFEEDES